MQLMFYINVWVLYYPQTDAYKPEHYIPLVVYNGFQNLTGAGRSRWMECFDKPHRNHIEVKWDVLKTSILILVFTMFINCHNLILHYNK